MFFKQLRIEDEGCLNAFRSFPCVACGHPPPSDPAHITSVGAGGGDTEKNLMSLCRFHHRLQHDQGWKFMAAEFRRVELALKNKKRFDILERD